MSLWCRWRRHFGVLSIVAWAIASSSCGYALAGQGNFLPAYIRTIGVPTFTNQTSYFDLAQIATDKVRTEFIGRGKYKVIPETNGADAVLSGIVTSISIVPTNFEVGQQASRYVITVTANIELRDVQKNTVLWANPYVTVREEQDATTTTSTNTIVDPSQFFNQETNAMKRITDEFARTVVSSILEAF
jgi:hypothetical protein